MKMRLLSFAAALIGTSMAMNAAAVVVDFDTAAGSPDGYVDSGITFSAVGSTSSFFSDSPNGSRAITMSTSGVGGVETFRADIGGGANSVSVDLGDFNADEDRVFLSIFDSLDNLLGNVTQDLASSFVGMVTLSLASVTEIAYATFGTTGELGIGGIYADNFCADDCSRAVPEPSVLGLLALAGIGLFGVSRRKG